MPIKSNEYVTLYGLSGEYTDKILHYEVDIIYNRKDQYDKREHIAKMGYFILEQSEHKNKDINREPRITQIFDYYTIILGDY